MRLVGEVLVGGVASVLRAPHMIASLYVLLVIVVLPASAALAIVLERAFDTRLVEALLPPAVDRAWFAEVQPTTATIAGNSFMPTMGGGAAVLSNVDDLASRSSTAVAVTATTGVWLLMWTLVLGGVLNRLAHPSHRGLGHFVRACAQRAPAFAVITLVSLLMAGVGVAVYAAAPTPLANPSLLFAAALSLAASLAAMHVRAHTVVRDCGLAAAAAAALGDFRRQPLVYFAHGVAGVAVLTVLIAAFLALDWSLNPGGSIWRGVILAQAFIVARLTLRLVVEAAALRIAAATMA